ncbi:DNA polymerase III, delta subunit [Buchnera aphidicola (Cinara tujafilina)]|uniref:DNA polymerase III subunit delta' n=1 Tax=Buchnera aphidicola (Cinara tujafilina) TaxID=261317 RepID=F7WZF1_9GAMM|nr:DNA polymerase III subunit delta' C-terminal domain-containing protein [Buchnera aphidicola]AEH39813.1 DNA polymerase III, delta subunit [Buchnera aphidicola (Cinara tujafilina)]
MKNYPWLFSQYKSILKKYIKNKLHPIILINSRKGLGIFQLIKNISQWFLCLNKKNFVYCNMCTSCTLIKKKNHPDLYDKNHYKIKNKTIGIDYIRYIIKNIYKTSQQGGVKIVVIKNLQNITKEANNALLKTLEEPPKDTFFLSTNNLKKINNTTISRSTIYYINIYNKTNIILSWLQKNKKIFMNDLKTALFINNFSPIRANNFLNSSQIIQRKNLMNIIYTFIMYNNNIDLLFSLLYYNNTHLFITWICYLLLDVIKFSIFKEKDILYNLDQYHLIKKLSKKSSVQYSYKILISWIKCQYILKTIPYIDKKLILIEQTLFWNNLLKSKK